MDVRRKKGIPPRSYRFPESDDVWACGADFEAGYEAVMGWSFGNISTIRPSLNKLSKVTPLRQQQLIAQRS
jgi:hypothetical protein